MYRLWTQALMIRVQPDLLSIQAVLVSRLRAATATDEFGTQWIAVTAIPATLLINSKE
jgi:hypothetical protein